MTTIRRQPCATTQVTSERSGENELEREEERSKTLDYKGTQRRTDEEEIEWQTLD